METIFLFIFRPYVAYALAGKTPYDEETLGGPFRLDNDPTMLLLARHRRRRIELWSACVYSQGSGVNGLLSSW